MDAKQSKKSQQWKCLDVDKDNMWYKADQTILAFSCPQSWLYTMQIYLLWLNAAVDNACRGCVSDGVCEKKKKKKEKTIEKEWIPSMKTQK